MSGFDLTLPRDVPWERIGTSVGLMDFVTPTKGGQYTRDTPNVWKPSLSIFSYVVPSEDAPSYPDQRIVYIRIPVTLTGIRPVIHREDPGFDILSPTDGIRLQFEESTPYLPCYGALVHVAVYPVPIPAEKDWHKYPYIMDMEPKRREIYQAITDSQQYLEGSTSQIVFGKSGSSEATTQAGFRFGASGSNAGGIPLEGGYSTGTSATQRAGSNLNVDWSREKRETLSHTSQINQISQVQVAYHLGSNRAFLSIQPRPGLDESEFVLVNGPRKIEGIQDFVLVINAPRALTGICIYAKVESAHIYRYRESDPGTLLVVSNEADGCTRFEPAERPASHPKIETTKAGVKKKWPTLPQDPHVVYERSISKPPQLRSRTSPRKQMHAINRYVEDQITRVMLDSVLSSSRYPVPVAFSQTRVAQATLARLVADLPKSDARNAPMMTFKALSRKTHSILKRAGINRLSDLYDPSMNGRLQGGGLSREALEDARAKVAKEILSYQG